MARHDATYAQRRVRLLEPAPLPPIQIGMAYREALVAYRKRPFALTLALVVGVLAESGVSRLSQSLRREGMPAHAPLATAALLLGAYASVLALRIALLVHEGEGASWRIIPSSLWRAFEHVAAGIAQGLIVIVGLALLVVPGIVWGLRISFTHYLMLDRRLNYLDAIQMSWRITKGLEGRLARFWLSFAVFNALGLVALGVGILVTLPVSILASVDVYRQVLERHGRGAEVA